MARCPRPGFTLVELLVVIAILAVLMALAAAGAFQVVGTQRQANTETTIRTVMKVLNQHWQQVIADAKKENMPSNFIALYPSLDQARTAWINLRLQEAFPIGDIEINTFYNPPPGPPPPGPPGSPYLNPRKYIATYRTRIGVNPASPAVCILLALSINRAGASLAPESLGGGQAIDAGTGLPMLVDGWGIPMVYYRDVNLVLPNGNVLTSNYYVPHLYSTADNPADPNGYISSDYLVAK